MSGENLKWMYEGKNSTIDHEQYLLGKKITTLQDEEEDKGDFLVKQQSSIATGNVTVLEKLDYESKVREDPLFQIRKNDFEHRKELLSNPLKKKRIQNMLKHALERDLRKSMTKRSHHESTSSSSETSDSDSSSDSDDNISKKSLKNDKLRKALKKQLESDLRNQKHKSTHVDRKRSPPHSQKRLDENRHTKSRKRSESDGEEKSKDRHSVEKYKQAGFGLTYSKNSDRSSSSSSTKRKRRERKTPSPEPENTKYTRKQKSGFSRKLTEDELEKKRKEMMGNATWRDDQRKHNITKYAQEEKKEKEEEEKVHQMKKKAEKRGGKAKDFLHDMKLHSASVGSLEDTVRRKRHTLSRKL